MAIKISGSTIIDDSRNIVSGAAATFTGNVTIGGTLTYEDVTNIDSVGIITAGNGLRVTNGGINVTNGISTFPNINITGVITASQIGNDADFSGGPLAIHGTVVSIKGGRIDHENMIIANQDGAVELYYDASKKLETMSTGVKVVGVLSATTLTGDGSALTGVGFSTDAQENLYAEVMSHLVKEHYPLVVVVISLHLVNLLVNIHLFSILFILVYTLEHVDVLMQRLQLDVTHYKVVLQ